MLKKIILTVSISAASAALSAANPTESSTQMVLAFANDWNSTSGFLRLFERGACKDSWKPVGDKIACSFGKNGMGWGIGLHEDTLKLAGEPEVVEGARRTPVGAFNLSLAFGKASKKELSVKLEYKQITPTAFGVDDIKSKFYNKIVDEKVVVKDWDSAEDMFDYMNQGVYLYGAFVEHNYQKPIPGKGSCFFLHVHRKPGGPTLGCTAFDANLVKQVICWLDPAKHPVLVQLPMSVYNRLKAEWVLPEFIQP